LSHFG